jgi:hypothetical protein
MKHLRRLLAALCLAGLLAPLGRELAAQTAAPAEIEHLIRLLGDPAFPQRERATRRLTELDDVALPALRAAAKDPDPEIRRRVESIVRAITELPPERRAAIAAAAAKAFAEADYETAAWQQNLLARRPRSTIDERITAGHDWQLAGKWAAASAAYLRAVDRIEEILNGDPENDPPPPPAPGPQNGPGFGNGLRGVVGLTDWQRRDLARRRAGLLLLAGRIQRDQAADPSGAVVTFSRVIASVPEFQGDLPTLLDTLAAAIRPGRAHSDTPQDIGRGLMLINEFEILDDLAQLQEQLNRPDDAILTLARLNAARLHTRNDGINESLSRMSALIQKSPAVRKLPNAAALVALIPPPAPSPAPAPKKSRLPEGRPPNNTASPFEWVPTNLGDFDFGPMAVRDLAKLPDGRWVAALTAGSRVLIATTRDFITWHSPRPHPASIIGNNIDPAITVDDRGEIWLAWFSNRLSLDPRGSGGFALWLAHSADAKTWSAPRAIAADTGGWPLGTMQWLPIAGQFRLSWRAASATAPSPALITRFDPIDMHKPERMWPMNPKVTCDSAGRFHLVLNDFFSGITYAASADGKSWSEPLLLVAKKQNGPQGGEPQLLIDGNRVALIHQDGFGVNLRRGVLSDLLNLSPAIQISTSEADIRWHRAGDQIIGFSSGEAPWLLRANVKDVFAPR